VTSQSPCHVESNPGALRPPTLGLYFDISSNHNSQCSRLQVPQFSRHGIIIIALYRAEWDLRRITSQQARTLYIPLGLSRCTVLALIRNCFQFTNRRYSRCCLIKFKYGHGCRLRSFPYHLIGCCGRGEPLCYSCISLQFIWHIRGIQLYKRTLLFFFFSGTRDKLHRFTLVPLYTLILTGSDKLSFEFSALLEYGTFFTISFHFGLVSFRSFLPYSSIVTPITLSARLLTRSLRVRLHIHLLSC
jgi:hypothetical protein